MKKNTHPKYQEVLFVDTATGDKFVFGTTLQSNEKEVFEGKEYPVCKVSVSSASHPFFTGSTKIVDSQGRVDKFKKRYLPKKEVKPSVEEVKDKPSIKKETVAKKNKIAVKKKIVSKKKETPKKTPLKEKKKTSKDGK